MHCSRNVARSSPSVIRVVRPGPSCRRNASFFPGPVGFPRFHGPAAFPATNDFAPFFRLFDDFGRHAPQAFQPRFDVREVGETYELRGELPGVEATNLEVEFTEPQTLVVRGRTESEHTKGTPPTAAATEESTKAPAEAEATADNDDAASTYSTGSYQKPSVEDETEGNATAESSADAAAATPATEPAKTEAVEKQEPQQPASRYWISERSTGSFQRVFKFPSRVDQDAVTASLKNGILNIVVPKAAAPAAKKITVE